MCRGGYWWDRLQKTLVCVHPKLIGQNLSTELMSGLSVGLGHDHRQTTSKKKHNLLTFTFPHPLSPNPILMMMAATLPLQNDSCGQRPVATSPSPAITLSSPTTRSPLLAPAISQSPTLVIASKKAINFFLGVILSSLAIQMGGHALTTSLELANPVVPTLSPTLIVLPVVDLARAPISKMQSKGFKCGKCRQRSKDLAMVRGQVARATRMTVKSLIFIINY